MDDDVQYLGTKLAQPEPLSDPCEPQEPVSGMLSPLFPSGRCSSVSDWTGIILHIDKCGDKAAHQATFYRSRTNYVNIGRKSGSGDKAMRRENDDHNAVFACQVVSARHAKLVLSDSGQVMVVYVSIAVVSCGSIRFTSWTFTRDTEHICPGLEKRPRH